MGRPYERLAAHLGATPSSALSLTFRDVEAILGFALPRTARRRSVWWANGGHSHARAWLSAGFKVDEVDLGAETVRFIRASGVRPPVVLSGAGERGARRRDSDAEWKQRTSEGVSAVVLAHPARSSWKPSSAAAASFVPGAS